jgi:hypothetical protein
LENKDNGHNVYNIGILTRIRELLR